MKTHLLVSLAVLTLTACGGSPSPNPPGTPVKQSPVEGPIAMSTQERVTSPVVTPANAAALTAGNTAFATSLYQTLVADPASAGKNVFFSPHSISLALAMTYAGARANTEKEMAKGLDFTLTQDTLHPAFDALDLALSSRGAGAKAADGGAFRLRVVNSLWGGMQTEFVPAFLDTLAENYGAGVRLTDFTGNPEGSRTTINAWVNAQTEGKIVDLIPTGVITSDTRVVLANAVYFNAAWANAFQTKDTKDLPFHALDGSTATASLMAESAEMPYAQGDGYEAVALPYSGDELSFIAIVPNAGTFATFEAGLNADVVASITSSLKTAEVNLSIPKFKIPGASFSLKKTLTSLGIKDAFNPETADFSGLTPAPLYISDVIHQAFISVDEKGTEAAAATAVIGVGTAAPAKVVTLTVDRPFVFAVRDNATGALVFLGRVVKP